jgi:hypothetical protein
MLRLFTFCGLVGLFFLTSAVGLCQGVPGFYPQPFPAVKPCVPSHPTPPISRTVQVDVPVPCPPVGCRPPMPCPPNLCGPPVCAPPPPTRPVQVNVDVRVRPEAPKPCAPERFCCENPPIFEPIFYQAAGLVQSLIAAPLALGERFMGHPVPSPLPAPTPIPCWRMPAAGCAPPLQPPPVTQCMPPCPPVRCEPPGPPVKVRPSCFPASARKYPPKGFFSR